MSPPRKHHYLPQFYLRQFSENGTQVYQVEKDGDGAYISAIEESAAIRDYHTLDYSGCPDPFAAEQKLSEVENTLSKALLRILKDKAVSDDVRADFSYFVSLVRVRVPAFKTHVEESLRQVVRATGEILERNGKLPPPPAGFEDVLQVRKLKIEILNWKLVQTMFEVAGDPVALEVLGAMTPSVLQVPRGMTLLTSDQPVALYNRDARPSDVVGYGPAHRATEITFPLSAQMLLRLSWDNTHASNRTLRESEVAEINRRTIVMANPRVFAPRMAGWVDKMVRRYRNCSAGYEFEIQPGVRGEFQLSKTRPVMRAEYYASRR